MKKKTCTNTGNVHNNTGIANQFVLEGLKHKKRHENRAVKKLNCQNWNIQEVQSRNFTWIFEQCVTYKVTRCSGLILPFFSFELAPLASSQIKEGSDPLFTHEFLTSSDTISWCASFTLCGIVSCHVIAIGYTGRLHRRNSLWEFSLRHVKATKHLINCLKAFVPSPTSRNVDDLVRYRSTKNQTIGTQWFWAC